MQGLGSFSRGSYFSPSFKPGDLEYKLNQTMCTITLKENILVKVVWKRIIQVLRRYIMLWGNIFQKTELIGNHSCPSITGFGWPGIRFKTIAARPFCSRIEALFTKWPVFSPSSCAVWRARALPSFLNCSRATLCQPPRDSATMGMNLIPCSLHSSSVFLHLLSKLLKSKQNKSVFLRGPNY